MYKFGKTEANSDAFRSDIPDYKTFLAENQRRVNLLLNKFLRFSILIGPLLMAAIAFGIFHSVSYTSCIIVSLLVLALSCIHYVLIAKERNTFPAAVTAFLVIDLLLVLMNSAHIGIYITWFVVPLISLLFSDFRIYAIAIVINYCMMTLSVWLVSPYYAGLRVDFDSPFQYFAGRMGGFTIETVIMAVAGYSLCKITTSYYRRLIEQFKILSENKRQINEQIQISMTDELTQLYNRRSYYADLEAHAGKGWEEDFVLFSIDVNGLKEVNDTKGHAAGDELLIAAADCLRKAIGPAGKVYRTGGDEFLAIVLTRTPSDVADKIRRFSKEWHGSSGIGLSLAVGYAVHAQHPDQDIHELEILADQMMYQEKELYYNAPGNDRRKKYRG